MVYDGSFRVKFTKAQHRKLPVVCLFVRVERTQCPRAYVPLSRPVHFDTFCDNFAYALIIPLFRDLAPKLSLYPQF